MGKLTHGGQREGAGRDPKDGSEDLKRVNAMLTEADIKKAKALGENNMSLGIRRALRNKAKGIV